MDIVLKNTPVKYEKMMEEIAPPLLELLIEVDSLEQEIFARDREMEKEKAALNIPSHRTHPKYSELVSEFRTRFGDFLDKRATDKLKAYGYARSYGNPSRYSYLKSGEYSAEFTMRKDDMASVVVNIYRKGELDKKHKFVLRLVDGVWLLDEKYYCFGEEKTWHRDTV